MVEIRSNTIQNWVEDKRQPLDKVFSHQSGKIYLTCRFGQWEEIKGTDQIRNVRDQMNEIRAATKKPAIRGPTEKKNQRGSEERTL
jgi:hypothetical protein